MTLVDTSVWIEHLARGNSLLRTLLNHNEVLIHPFIVGELACGSLKNRAEILRLLSELPHSIMARHEEVLQLVDKEHLFRTGIGWIDAHLIASAMLSRAKILTLDRQFLRVVSALQMSQ